jgi:predicted MFS family arabinose efflux permease
MPALSQILAKGVPAARLATAYSFVQMGFPLGLAVCGFAVPLLVTAFDWQVAVLSTTVVLILPFAVLQRMKPFFDRDRDPTAPLRRGSLVAPVLLVLRHRPLRRVTVAAFAMALMQFAILGYMASFLNLELGYTLVIAGLMITASQVLAALGRVLFGWFADRSGEPFLVLGLLAVSSGILAALAAIATPSWPAPLVALVVAAATLTAMGWNGIFFATVAKNAPSGDVPTATAGALVFNMASAMFGPLIFAGIVSLSGRYSIAFLCFATVTLVVGIRILVERARHDGAHEPKEAA